MIYVCYTFIVINEQDHLHIGMVTTSREKAEAYILAHPEYQIEECEDGEAPF